MKSKQFLVTVVSLFVALSLFGQENTWRIVSKNSIQRVFALDGTQAYSDNIEMAGKRVAAIVAYAVDSLGHLAVEREVFFPQLHPFIKENDPSWYIYRSYLKDTYTDLILPQMFIGDKQFAPGPLKKSTIDGMLHFEHHPSTSGVVMKRSFLPSMSERLFVEHISLTNTTDQAITIRAARMKSSSWDRGEQGSYITSVFSDVPDSFQLGVDETFSFSISITAQLNEEPLPTPAFEKTQAERNAFLSSMSGSLQLETPDEVLNTLFEFSKTRASESIFESKLGLIHSPGGGRYYVGIWANDQAEYVNPFFPYLGYDVGHQSAMNTYRAFAKEINPEYRKLPYAFEVEGLPPPSPLDRGDAAMIAYGAGQYALATGDPKIAQELWPLITWCLEYNRRQLNKAGVVRSESDEMEGRIETGEANLATSSLYYGALRHASDLGRSLGKSKTLLKRYQKQAKKLRRNMESYFGATIEGLNTYRYYDGHTTLRHWICLPLVVGIDDRKEGTINALFDRLWSGKGGVHVEKNNPNKSVSEIFWDRGTLYALRGTLIAGATEVSLEKLQQFSKERLLGNRVPYVVEAYPEGGMAHLSAESGLYCRVFIEGLFGINPTGLDSFSLNPRLPDEWDAMALRKIEAFGESFDIEVKRTPTGGKIAIKESSTGKLLWETDSKLLEPVSFHF